MVDEIGISAVPQVFTSCANGSLYLHLLRNGPRSALARVLRDSRVPVVDRLGWKFAVALTHF